MRQNTASSRYPQRRYFPLALLASLPVASSVYAAGGLYEYLPYNGGSYAYFLAITPDGLTAAGVAKDGSRSVALRWTSTGGQENLGSLLGGDNSSINGLSADGKVLVGSANLTAGGSNRAFRWTQATGAQNLGTLGGNQSSATAVTSDGNTVVGWSYNAATYQRAFRWTQASGMQDLGSLNGGHTAVAIDVSGNGSVIVGRATDGNVSNEDRAARWTQATGWESLGTLPGHHYGAANAVSADGSVIAGSSAPSSSINNSRAFRWTQATGMQDLGTLPGGTYSLGLGISADGSTIVGGSEGASAGPRQAFRWTQTTGMQTIEQWLADNGVVVDSSIKASQANGTNQDGSIVVGSLQNNHAFIACIRRCGNGGSGLIDTQQFNGSLYSVAYQAHRGLGEADLAVNGLHSRPLAFTLREGEGTAWVGGDLGRAERAPGSGTVGNGEVGVAYGLSDKLMLRAAVGRTGSDLNSEGDSSIDAKGTFVLPELVAQLGDSPFYLTTSVYYNHGDAHIRRGYLNAGKLEHGDGTPTVDSRALRLRLDWLNAYQAGQLSVNPYASVSWYRSHVDGYTETGANFPVQWDRQQARQTVLRLGSDVRYTLNDSVTLTGLLELAHRSREQGERVQGRIIGLNAFSLDSADQPRSWARLGLGLEAKLGPGVLGLMLNANSRSRGNRWWLNASYRIAF